MAGYQKYDMVPAIKNRLAERKDTTNSDLLDFTLLLLDNSRGADMNDVEGLEKRFFQYLELCKECNMKVGNLAAYTAIGITKFTAQAWARGAAGEKKQDLIMKIKAVCAQYREAMMMEGTLKEITGIFWQKSFDDFRDNTAITEEVSGILEREISPDDIIKKYSELPED